MCVLFCDMHDSVAASYMRMLCTNFECCVYNNVLCIAAAAAIWRWLAGLKRGAFCASHRYIYFYSDVCVFVSRLVLILLQRSNSNGLGWWWQRCMAAVNSVCDTVHICTRELSGDDVPFTYIERNYVHLQNI